jgi:hypothetical protein
MGLRGNMQSYFAANGLIDYHQYLKIDQSDRLTHYNNWLNALDPRLADTLDVSLVDIDYGNQITEIIKKACSADLNQRYVSVADMANSVKGL